MNREFIKTFRLDGNGTGCLFPTLFIGLLIFAFGFKWLVNGLLIILLLLIVIPALSVWGLRWWLQSKLVEDKCPVCSYEFTGFKSTECQCPNCGEVLKVEHGHFHRLTPPGTIDVEAIEVSSAQLED